MILVDTGPLVALFDPADSWHERCVAQLKAIQEPILTTLPILTEAFHLLTPNSRGARGLMDFVADGGLGVWFQDDGNLSRAFELMQRYADVPMDFADASLLTAAEALNARKVFTIDRKDFAVYRVRHGHRHLALEILELV
jgi:predicted nucleic acid-binding protein